MNNKALIEITTKADWICPTCWCWPPHTRVFLNDNNHFDLHDGDEIKISDKTTKIICLNCEQELY